MVVGVFIKGTLAPTVVSVKAGAPAIARTSQFDFADPAQLIKGFTNKSLQVLLDNN